MKYHFSGVALSIFSLASAVRAAAQALYDLPAVGEAYEMGKDVDVTVSTTGEYLMCAAYWSAITSATSGGYISAGHLAELDADFTGDGSQHKEDVFMALGAGANNAEERSTDYYHSASERFAGFIAGEPGYCSKL